MESQYIIYFKTVSVQIQALNSGTHQPKRKDYKIIETEGIIK